MKYSILTSFTLTMLTFVGAANANTITPSLAPGVPTSLEQALQQGISQQAYANFLDAKNNCDSYHSINDVEWTDCIAKAEHALMAAQGGPGPSVGEDIPMSTNAANADASRQSPDEHKGFRFQDQ